MDRSMDIPGVVEEADDEIPSPFSSSIFSPFSFSFSFISFSSFSFISFISFVTAFCCIFLILIINNFCFAFIANFLSFNREVGAKIDRLDR